MELWSDEDYLTSRLHGRHSRMVEGARLDLALGLPDLEALSLAVELELPTPTALALQRAAIQRHVDETWELCQSTWGARRDYIRCNFDRFLLSNHKCVLRTLVGGKPISAAQPHLFLLPPGVGSELPFARGPATPEEFAASLALDPFGAAIGDSLERRSGPARLFFIEADLDRAQGLRLLQATAALSPADRAAVAALSYHEVDSLLLLLSLRGRFSLGLTAELLAPLWVPGARLTKPGYGRLLTTQEPATAANSTLGIVIDHPPPQPPKMTEGELSPWLAAIEALALSRALRLAQRVFRSNRSGFAATVGYIALRRLELCNLTTLSEGLRLGISKERLRLRLIPLGTGLQGEAHRA